MSLSNKYTLRRRTWWQPMVRELMFYRSGLHYAVDRELPAPHWCTLLFFEYMATRKTASARSVRQSVTIPAALVS